MIVRDATIADLPVVARMLDACMTELFKKSWSGSVDQLERDLGARVVIHVAGAPLAGFIAWAPAYDIHHSVQGGEICELFVERAHRGRAVAPALIAHACRAIGSQGGVFIRGTAVASAVPLYARVAWGWDCREMILGGRAFRAVASLAGASARDFVRGIPDASWNLEP